MFRTSFGQQIGMPKIANYIRDELKAKTIALIWVNNDFGKGGRDRLIKELTARNIKLVADVSTESGQVDFAADVVKLKAANADAVFVYSNEEECARIMREARKQGLKGPFVGDTTLLSQKTIELAGEAANGVVGHVGLTVDAPMQEVKEFGERFQKRFNYKPDHNGLKGYTAVYAVKYVDREEARQVRPQGAARTRMHGLTITPKDEPGILIETTWDNDGEIDRISFLAEVVERQAEDRQDPAEARQVALADFLQLLVAGLATGGDLRAGRDRLHAALADLADDQLRPGRVRHAAGVLRADRHGLLRPAVLAAALLGGLVVARSCSGSLFKKLMVDPMIRHGVLPLVIATIGLAILMKEAVREFYGADAWPFPRALGRRPTSPSSARSSRCRACSSSRSASPRSRALQLFLDGTRTGRCMQATAQNPTVARLLGIPRRAHDPLHLPDQRGAGGARVAADHARSTSPSSPTASGSACTPSSPRSSAASTRYAARSSAACCSAWSTTSPPSTSPRNTAWRSRC